MNTIDHFIGFSAQALKVRSDRMQVLSENIANADTPNYKARDVKFSKVLQDVAYDNLSATSNLHMTHVQNAPRNGIMYRIPLNNSFDGNTVEIGVEQAQYGKAAGDYRASLAFIESRTSAIRRALKGE